MGAPEPCRRLGACWCPCGDCAPAPVAVAAHCWDCDRGCHGACSPSPPFRTSKETT